MHACNCAARNAVLQDLVCCPAGAVLQKLTRCGSLSSAARTVTVQAQIATLEAALEASAAKAAALKARAEAGDVAQGLCLAGGPQLGGVSSSAAGPGAAGAGGPKPAEGAGPSGQVGLDDLSKAVKAAYQR
jgi:hypothetical protein